MNSLVINIKATTLITSLLSVYPVTLSPLQIMFIVSKSKARKYT